MEWRKLKLVRRIAALLTDAFWERCKLCRRHFGGQEPGLGELYLGGGLQVYVCNAPACVAQAAALSRSKMLTEYGEVASMVQRMAGATRSADDELPSTDEKEWN